MSQDAKERIASCQAWIWSLKLREAEDELVAPDDQNGRSLISLSLF